jgi:hypothetical protein
VRELFFFTAYEFFCCGGFIVGEVDGRSLQVGLCAGSNTTVVLLANPKPEKVRFRVEIGRFGLARRVEIVAPNVAPKSVKIDTFTLFAPKSPQTG